MHVSYLNYNISFILCLSKRPKPSLVPWTIKRKFDLTPVFPSGLQDLDDAIFRLIKIVSIRCCFFFFVVAFGWTKLNKFICFAY